MITTVAGCLISSLLICLGKKISWQEADLWTGLAAATLSIISNTMERDDNLHSYTNIIIIVIIIIIIIVIKIMGR